MGVYDKGVDWIKKGLGVFTSKRDEKGVTYATTMLGMALRKRAKTTSRRRSTCLTHWITIRNIKTWKCFLQPTTRWP